MFNKKIIWIILIICVVCFFLLAEDVFTHEIMIVDFVGYELISKYLISDTLTPIMKCITLLGGASFLLTITFLLFIFLKNKKYSVCIGANLIIITIINQVLKVILQRPRPIEHRLINETGYSFPSGHSMISMAFYGYLIYLVYKHISNNYYKWFLIIILSLLILFIGVSRIYLGVHYVSDVIAGFAISIVYLIIFILIVNKK